MKAGAAGDSQDTGDARWMGKRDGTRVKPEFGSGLCHLMGPDADHPRAHMTIAVPGATTASLGLPSDNKQVACGS